MTRRSHRWWHGVDAEGEDPGSERGREPWADRPRRAAALTTAQQAVLAGLDDQPDGPRLDGITTDDGDCDDRSPDQPAVPRLRPGNGSTPAGRTTTPGTEPVPGSWTPGTAGGRPGNGTGNAPGDPEEPRPYRRTRWMEPEQER